MSRKFSSIQDAIEDYDIEQDRDVIDLGEKEREEILALFPIESWQTMTLDQYALGQPEYPDNYCRWAEFLTPEIGSIRGGSSTKHLIYKKKNDPGWYFSSNYSNKDEAWEDIRAGFIKSFELASEGKWDEIDEIQSIMGGKALRSKTLHIYFSEEILAVFSIYHIRHFLELLSVYSKDMDAWEVIRLNRFLLQELKQIEEIKNWSTSELMRFLYFWADPKETKRVFKIAPGRDAEYWEDCLKGGYICVGWDEVGDLRNFNNKKEFIEHFSDVFSEEHKNHKPTLTKKGKELWTLVELEPGDLIVANQGISKILGVGEVLESGYEWSESRENFKHTVKVKWDESFQKDIPPQKRWGLVTVAPIGVDLYNRLISSSGLKKSFPITPVIDPIFIEYAEALERKGQLVLYGPPGTGKTYHARRFAEWWLNKKNIDEKENIRITRNVWWVVANPKIHDWEALFKDGEVDFNYGRFQRNYPQLKPGDLVIGYQSNPTKQIKVLAEVTKGMESFDSNEPKITIKPFKLIENGLTYQELLDDPIMKNSEPLRNRCQGTLFKLSEDEAQHYKYLQSEKGTDLTEAFSSVNYAFNPFTLITFHPSYSYEDFVEGYRPMETSGDGLVLKMENGIFKQICQEALAHPKTTYLLLIDEINRANLAKVFGELITLLEKDKRGVTLTLPQSKEVFQIPANVFMLGTMNTADRSIKLMDTALRRRFAFIEVMPDLEILRGAAINELPLDDFLEVLNHRIVKVEGREKQIGHAYLMENDQPITDSKEFGNRFRQDILPLLQEYCYDDYSALEDFLSSDLVDSENQTLEFELINDDDKLISELAKIVKIGA